VSYRDRQAALSSSDTPKPGILVLIYSVSYLAIARLKNIFPFTAFSSTIIRFVGAAVSKLSVAIRFYVCLFVQKILGNATLLHPGE
jgi:hypothetical protein